MLQVIIFFGSKCLNSTVPRNILATCNSINVFKSFLLLRTMTMSLGCFAVIALLIMNIYLCQIREKYLRSIPSTIEVWHNLINMRVTIRFYHIFHPVVGQSPTTRLLAFHECVSPSAYVGWPHLTLLAVDSLWAILRPTFSEHHLPKSPLLSHFLLFQKKKGQAAYRLAIFSRVFNQFIPTNDVFTWLIC